MVSKIQAVRGMNDILPEQSPVWQYVERELRRVVTSYGYSEIRFPIIESTSLFERSVGEVTDIVKKEMYTFEDRNNESLTLRPEGTAGCVRAGIEHGLFYNQQQRLWYSGPFFRHERPQKGRYRQFYQFGVEAVGMEGPDIDAEIILMTYRMWKNLGLVDNVKLQLNTLGSSQARAIYHKQLVEYFSNHFGLLDEESKQRLNVNPLRILDSKNPELQELIIDAPKLLDVIDEASEQHFEKLCAIIDEAKIPCEINPRLVRGLDYYSRTVFEWVTTKLGAQDAICGGGRFDGLIELMGGKPTPAIGFAIGLERLIALLHGLNLLPELAPKPHVYFVMAGEDAEKTGLLLAEKLRDEIAGIQLLINCGAGGFKSQFKKADKSGAKLAVILGEQEVVANKITIKYLREDKPQEVVPIDDLVRLIKKILESED